VGERVLFNRDHMTRSVYQSHNAFWFLYFQRLLRDIRDDAA